MNMNRTLSLTLVVFLFGSILSGCGSANEPPTVRITSPVFGETQGASVEFRAHFEDPDGEIESILWDFGDGDTSPLESPAHDYQVARQYQVEVTVTDSEGATARDSITIEVEIGPTARAAAGRIDEGSTIKQYIEDESPLEVEFDAFNSRAAPGTSIVSYHWDFDNGDTSDQVNPVYTYREAGDYDVVLTVTDDQGHTDQARVTIRVISYEAVQETLELENGPVDYELVSKSDRNVSTGKSFFYNYVVNADRRLTASEIEQIINDIVQKAKGRPNALKISVQLFTEEILGMMTPREYAHYLGSGIWARDNEDQSVSVTLNNRYLDGTAIEVAGYTMQDTMLQPGDPDCGPLCNQFKIGIAQILIEDENICFELLDQTLHEIIDWSLSATYHGYLAAVYKIGDLADPIAWISGSREEGPGLTELPYHLFPETPPGWNTPQSDHLRFNYTDIPACGE